MAGKSKRGFASMDPQRQREIASKGGRAAHAKGTAHEWTSDEARVAGRKGGEVVSRDREHMATIGREGGESRGAKARRLAEQRQTETTDAASVAGAPRPESQPAVGFDHDTGRGYVERESPLGVSREQAASEESLASGERGSADVEGTTEDRARSSVESPRESGTGTNEAVNQF